MVIYRFASGFPACATGEEAYSIAILLLECLPSPPQPAIRFRFSPPISASKPSKWRAMAIIPKISPPMSPPERLQKFFTKSSGGYQINKHVRDLCIFAVQDVTKDPPFSRMDLISCCNLLIYLGVPLQKKVLAAFHYALNPDGYLLLGSSESVEAGSDAFRQVDKKHKFYSRLLTSARPTSGISSRRIDRQSAPPPQERPERSQTSTWARQADRIVLSRYSPPGVLINSSCRCSAVSRPHGAFPGAAARPGDSQSDQDGPGRIGHRSSRRYPPGQENRRSRFARPACGLETTPASTEVTLEVIPVSDKSACQQRAIIPAT